MKQNCFRCNNCIHESVCYFWIYENYPSDFYENCMQYQEERLKGKWEFVQYDGNPNIGNWHCTKCGYISLLKCIPPHNYCPNCGANMEGENT